MKCATSPAASSWMPSLEAAVFGISVDSPFAQHAWADQHEITIKLLSDFNKSVIKAYDLILSGLNGIGETAARAVVVVNKTGKIVYVEQTPKRRICPTSRRSKPRCGRRSNFQFRFLPLHVMKPALRRKFHEVMNGQEGRLRWVLSLLLIALVGIGVISCASMSGTQMMAPPQIPGPRLWARRRVRDMPSGHL